MALRKQRTQFKSKYIYMAKEPSLRKCHVHLVPRQILQSHYEVQVGLIGVLRMRAISSPLSNF